MIELIELSALAWTIINSDGEHDSIERAWTAAQPDDWTPAEGVDELRIRLSEISDLLQAAGETALLEVVSAVIVYLAIHPDRRRVEHAVIGEALNEQYGEALPGEIAAWLARQPSPAAHRRHHGARARHFHSRPAGGAERRVTRGSIRSAKRCPNLRPISERRPVIGRAEASRPSRGL